MKKITLAFLLAFLFSTICHSQSNTANVKEIVVQKVKVFPNPATNIINVLGLKNSESALIIVSDVYGNSVLEHKWEITNQALNIPIAHLERGIYLISIQSKEQAVKTKFYKQ